MDQKERKLIHHENEKRSGNYKNTLISNQFTLFLEVPQSGCFHNFLFLKIRASINLIKTSIAMSD